MIEYNEAKKIAMMLAAVGEPTRMQILYRLTAGPHNVGQLAELVGIPMVNMSHHLGVMRQAGLLEDTKDGRRVVYRLRPEIYRDGGTAADVLGTLNLGGYRLSVVRLDGANGSAGGKGKKKADK